ERLHHRADIRERDLGVADVAPLVLDLAADIAFLEAVDRLTPDRGHPRARDEQRRAHDRRRAVDWIEVQQPDPRAIIDGRAGAGGPKMKAHCHDALLTSNDKRADGMGASISRNMNSSEITAAA